MPKIIYNVIFFVVDNDEDASDSFSELNVSGFDSVSDFSFSSPDSSRFSSSSTFNIFDSCNGGVISISLFSSYFFF